MSRLRVLQSAEEWLPLTETWLYTQITRLPETIESHVVCRRTLNTDRFPIGHLSATLQQPHLRRGWDRFLRALGRRHAGLPHRVGRDRQVRLVHSHFGDRGWRDQPVAAALRCRHVVTFYGQDVGRLPTVDPRWRDRYDSLFETVDMVLCEGPHMARQIRELGCPAAKVSVHHLGVDLTRIPFRYRRWRRGEPLRILMAASFREKKGIPNGLEAIARSRSRAAISVTIIGDAGPSSADQAEKRRIIKSVERLGSSGSVRMLGYLGADRLMEEALEHDIFLAPSVTAADGDTEGGAPMAIIEMAASGMPVVSTRHADIPNVIEHGVAGLLADEGDIDGLASHLDRLVDDPDAWEAMARAARRHVEKEFDADTQAVQLAARYRQLVGV